MARETPLPGRVPDGLKEVGSGANEARQAFGKIALQADLPVLIELADFDGRKSAPVCGNERRVDATLAQARGPR